MVAEAPRLGPGLTHRDDPRITAVGRILRKTKFDEFPQVINVLKGDMSIIGPRPEAPQYAEAYPKDFKSILQMRPGLTSLAQVTHRNEEQMLPAEDTEDYYLSVILPRKLSMDMYYVDHWSLGLDLRVFLLGVLALLKVAPPAWLWPADVVVSLPAEDPRIMSSRN
jgi:lipopolysaccharide/colanic/teichoic acid biosynthesis glycosyltransferase